MPKPTLRAETRTLPEIIKKIRSGLGETQKKFGDRFGVSAPLVCQWESGYREPNASVFMFVLEHELAQVEAKARLNLLNEVRGLVEGMRERECFCNSCYSRTVIKGKPTRSPHCENSGYDTVLDDLLSELNKLETTNEEEL